MILGGGGVALLGLRDDLAGLRVRWRLLGQTGAALWAVWWLDGVPTFFLGPWEVVNGWFVYGLALFAFVWLLNLFNFMDGLDGLAASEAGFVTLLSSLLLINSGDQVTDLLSLLTLAAVLGFLVWNWPPARIFMGDAGSGFLGYMLGILALWSIAAGSISVWSWLLMMGVFAIDATYTLFRRIADGQGWYLGHDTHAYQHAARRFGSHDKVVVAILTINLFWLAPLAWLANLQPQAGLWLTMLGWFPLILLARMIGAGSQLTAGRAGTESARS
jgi:Fuc2NAc and GlcNAc transferase